MVIDDARHQLTDISAINALPVLRIQLVAGVAPGPPVVIGVAEVLADKLFHVAVILAQAELREAVAKLVTTEAVMHRLHVKVDFFGYPLAKGGVVGVESELCPICR
ncbi:hypothetical protein VME0621_04676 [Vibrio mediterranei]|nr:hypothetical protein VME0621_04676 [Vibrio mediterranei]